MDNFVISVSKQTLFLVLILSAGPVIAALVVGLLVSILQATTQIQEQTLTFVPKLIAIILTLVFAGPWMMTQAIMFTRSILELFPTVVQG